MGQGFRSTALWVEVGYGSVVGFGLVVTCLFVDGLVGLGFWVGDWLRQLMGGGGFGWGLAGFVWVGVWLGFVWVVKDLAGI